MTRFRESFFAEKVAIALLVLGGGRHCVGVVLFALKKIFGMLAMPLPLVLVSALVGVVLLRVGWRRFPRFWKFAGRGCLLFSLFALLVFSNNGVCRWMLLRYETRYAAQPDFPEGVVAADSPLGRCRYVLVLGGGSEAIHARSALQRLPGTAQLRLAEGLRIARALPDARLVVSGGGYPNFPTAARESEEAAVSLGFPRERIVRFDHTADTRAEIRAAHALSGGAPVALVTSAFHLPRAMKLCSELGVDAVPCPADYALSRGTLSLWDFVSWNPLTLGMSSVWFHEFLGSLFS